ncbi:MAG: MATE family efflux transporter [Gammaproteobacteria bacterium]|nr:MATE family efflux transporter [Gammaproteobacteria bacterium]
MPIMKAYTKLSVNEISVLITLAIPLILTGFIEASVGFFTTLFLAHLGSRELAAGAVVQWIFFTMMVVLWGTLCAVSILIAQKHGEKDDRGVSKILRDGLVLGIVLFFPAFLLLRNIAPVLALAGQDAATIALAVDYMNGLSWGLLPDFIGLVLMQFLIGLGHTRTNMFFTLIWVPLNIFCNYGLIFGEFGFPALGMAGIGWGTTLAYWILAVFLACYLLWDKSYRRYFEGVFIFAKPRFLAELCQIGVPMGAMYCIEIAFFLTLTLLMGRLGSDILAANQITMQYLGEASVATFAIAQAITVRMGHMIGAGKIHLAERAVYIGVVISIVFMVFVGGIYCISPTKLIELDLSLDQANNSNIISYAIQFFSVAALFQLLEAIRITLFGALRGLKDTRFTLLSSVISFWVVSLPIGYVMAINLHMGGMGLWWGAVIGAVVGVVLLALRFHYKMKGVYRNAKSSI